MNNYIKGTLVKLLAIVLILVIALAVSIGFLVKDDYFKDITNSCRVLVSDQIYNIVLNNKKGDEGYKYTIISLDGKVIKSTETEYPQKISINNISLDNWYEINNKGLIRYSSPYIVDGKIENIIVFSIPKEDILSIREGMDFKFILKIIVAIIFVLIIINLFKIYKLINKDALTPIKEMHNSASEILKGNYLKRVNYDYYGEIGEFSHDFESMRDNLMVASEKEKKLKMAEKELLACISHDLKTPIANISGYCEGIIDGVVREEKITQVINNIVNNSIKYTNDDGIITISLNKINEGIEINIEDNGIGIAADEVDLVFNKFYRSEKHRNQNIPGSGLGLSIAKYITEMHNGSIKIISGKEIGTRVIIKIRNKYLYPLIIEKYNNVGV